MSKHHWPRPRPYLGQRWLDRHPRLRRILAKSQSQQPERWRIQRRLILRAVRCHRRWTRAIQGSPRDLAGPGRSSWAHCQPRRRQTVRARRTVQHPASIDIRLIRVVLQYRPLPRHQFESRIASASCQPCMPIYGLRARRDLS